MKKTRTNLPLTIVFILIGLSSFFRLPAQTLNDARNAAFSGERVKAREICKTILSKGFDSDVATLMGRTFAWDGQYDSARFVLKNALSLSPQNNDILDAISDVEYWSDHYEEALRYCNIALEKNPANASFLYKKARILRAKSDYKLSAETLETLLANHPDHGEAIRLLEKVRLDLIKNKIAANYTYDHFDKSANNRDPWQMFYLQYSRKTGMMGTVIGRVNYANRFNHKGIQFEADAYPHISENNYVYLNLGYSASSIFPNHRGGIEWYHSFPHGFEGSVGNRILHFNGSKRIIIYTGSIGKYLGNYWFSLRPFITPGDQSTSISTYVIARRYFSDPENYVGVRLGIGSSPDERMRLFMLDPANDASAGFSTRLRSQSVKVEYNHIFHNSWIFNTGAALANEEYWQSSTSSTKYGMNFSLEVGLAHLF